MKTGVVFPQTEIGSDPQQVRDYILAVEDMGFDFLLAYDHVIGANPDREGSWKGPYTHEHQFHEILTLFAYGAAITKNLEFVSGILILPQRSTALVAKQTAQIDILSGGRLRLGVAVGWNQVEMEALGERFSNRGKRIEEQVEVLRLLWTNELVTYEGKYHKLDNVGINPLPVQRPIPIWFGGYADVVLRRMARIGDGWMPGGGSLEKAQEEVDKVKRYLAENGRNYDDFGVDVRLSVSRQPESEWDKIITAWQNMGATHISMNTMGAGYTSLDEHLATLRKFKRHI
ncbi:MAG: LLM class F420-dependent oxidoreductase [Anaerolineae bacterium]|nr:LLM class F420-dependent oxidoreductase [Anaerolineae bacterium]MDQ7034901.1 LLM class F420-dependent oxidoreductase [Anaerolineae bacterium]